MQHDSPDDHAKRRNVLESFEVANASLPAGMGASSSHVLVGRFVSPARLHEFRRRLTVAGISPIVYAKRFEATVFVPRSQSAEALNIGESHRNEPRPPNKQRLNRSYDLVVFCVLFTCPVAAILALVFQTFLPIAKVLISLGVFLLVLDRLAIASRWQTMRQFRILDLLLLSTAIASLLAVMQL